MTINKTEDIKTINVLKIMLILLGTVWFAFVLYSWFTVDYNKWHVTDLRNFSFANFYIGPNFLGNLLVNSLLFIKAIIFSLCCYGIGRYILVRFLNHDYSILERFIFSFALGIGTAGFITFFIAASQILYTASIIIFILIPGLLLGFKSIKIIPVTLPNKEYFLPNKEDINCFNIILFLYILLFAFMNSLFMFSPDVKIDPLNYHLAIPSWWLYNHGITDMPQHIYHNLFMLYGCVYAAAMSLGDDLIAKAVNTFVSSTGSIFISVYLCRKYFDKKALLLTLGILCTSYHISELSFITGSDSFSLLFSLSMLSAVLLYIETKKRNLLILAAILAGFAMAAKATTLLIVITAMGILIYADWKNKKQLCRNLIIFILIASLPVIPWLIKNSVLRGNPFFPFLTSIFGSDKYYDPNMILFFQKASNFYLGDNLAIVKNLWNLFISKENALNIHASPVLLAFALFIPLIFKVKDKISSIILIFCISSLFIQLKFFSIIRFYLPQYIIAVIAFSYYLIPVLKKNTLLKPFLLSLLLLCLIPTITTFNYFKIAVIPFGTYSRDQYMRQTIMGGYYSAMTWASEHLPKDAKVLDNDALGFGYYLKRNYFVTSMYDKDWPNALFNDDKIYTDNYDFAKKLKELGFSNVIMNTDKYCISPEVTDYLKQKQTSVFLQNIFFFNKNHLHKIYESPQTDFFVGKTAIYEIL